MKYWYEDEKKVIELAEFLVQSAEISTTDELLDFFKYPEKYTGVWDIYEEQILGREPVHIGFPSLKKFPIANHIACACSEK